MHTEVQRIMNQLVLLATAASAVLITALPASAAADNLPDGTIERSCAPYDGPAFEVRTRRADGQVIKLMGMDELSAKPNGTWAVTFAEKPGSGSAAICDDRKPMDSRCALGNGGSFSIKQLTPTRWAVDMSVLFVQGDAASKITAHFTASAPNATKGSSPQRCG